MEALKREVPLLTLSVAAHILLILALALQWSSPPPQSLQKQKKMVVQTVALKERVQDSPKAKEAPTRIEAAVAKVKEPAPKASVVKAKPQTKKKAVPKTPKKAEAKSTSKSTDRSRLLASVAETIAKIDRDDVKLVEHKKVTAPQKIESVAFEGATSGYHTLLAGALRRILVLPEYGAVQVALTLERSGAVALLKVLNAESARNREYVELHLPSARFAPFGSSFGGEMKRTFVITLTNE